MTSNAGAHEASKGGLGINPDRGSTISMDVIKKNFRPEFLNRLDATLEFQNLSEDILLKVIEKFVGELKTQLASKKIELDVDPGVYRWLFVKGHDPAYGARPFARTVDEFVKRPMVDEILFGKIEKGGTVRVREKKGQLVFDYSSLK
jgi:ATP-dependent Clp protease ATP-binding subunit ClpA